MPTRSRSRSTSTGSNDVKDPGDYQPYSYFQLMEVSLRELLVEKGIVSEAQVAATVEDMRKRTPERGARVVAKAWTDPAFKARLLENGSAAVGEFGIAIPEPCALVLLLSGAVAQFRREAQS